MYLIGIYVIDQHKVASVAPHFSDFYLWKILKNMYHFIFTSKLRDKLKNTFMFVGVTWKKLKVYEYFFKALYIQWEMNMVSIA